MNHIKQFQEKHGLVADGIIGKKTIHKMRCVFGIETDAQMAHFLANVHHETGGFTADTENLNYSASGLEKVFKRYFPDHKTATAYARNPIKIANKVYANRMGNGDELSGDGWMYIGRGALQLTGKNNYRAFAEYVGDKMIMLKPHLVAEKYFWESAIFYFTKNNLWPQMKFTDANAVRAVRKAVNGGYNGLEDVQQLFTKYYNIITK